MLLLSWDAAFPTNTGMRIQVARIEFLGFFKTMIESGWVLTVVFLV
jgi:hypothetical protein